MTKVLIVEDEKAVAEMYQKKVENAGYDVLIANNGKDGLESALNDKPDVILLDIKMPVMDGMEMLKRLRTDPWGANVPVIVLTALEASEDITQKVAETEPSYYLLKAGNRPSVVLEKIKELIKE